VNKFIIIPGDNFIWNQTELVQFLIHNQNQDIVLNTHEEGCCLSSIGLYNLLDLFNFKSVIIESNNIFETHPIYKISFTNAFKFFELPIVEYSQFHTWNNNTVFGALYNRALWHRIGLASHLYKYSATLNFRSNPHNEDSRRLFELQRLFDIDPDSVLNFIKIVDHLPIQIEMQDGYTVGNTTKGHTDQLAQFYTNFLIDIVAETFTSGRTFFPTEKTVRPMLLKKPFIIMGPKCYLIHLRQMGFKTFYEFWNEEYDGYGLRERYLLILNLIDDISKKSLKELQDMYTGMQYILDHNYNLLLEQSYNKQLDYVD
jgi:hypothetical protein